MIDFKNPKVSVCNQCRLLNLNRSSVYYQPVKTSCQDLAWMRLIDEQYLKTPFYGSRSMTLHFRRLGYNINRKRIRRLMRHMGIEAIYPKPKTSRPHPDHKIYPYRLRELTIDRPNQVWAADITYVPMARGFMFLVAVMDWYSRKVLSFKLSNTLDTDFCLEAVQEAIQTYGPPEIFNTDQGAQFTSRDFTGLLEQHQILISMDGRGRVQDNIFIERLWWTVKYQFLYLRSFESGIELRQGLGEWFRFYNQDRPHQSFGLLTPDEVFYGLSSPLYKAA
jgi:putative transposase